MSFQGSTRNAEAVPLRVCAVPECRSKNTTHPKKLFFPMPWVSNHRLAWFKAIGRKPTSTACFVCEDHFNVQEDIQNYVEFKYYAGGGKKLPIFKPNLVPHIFNCKRQPNAETILAERKRKALVEKLLRDAETRTNSTQTLRRVESGTAHDTRTEGFTLENELDDEPPEKVRIKTEDDVKIEPVDDEDDVKVEFDAEVKAEEDDATDVKPVDSPFFEMEIDPSSIKLEDAGDPACDPLTQRHNKVDSGTQTSPPKNVRDMSTMASPRMVDFSINCDLEDLPSEKQWEWRCLCCPQSRRRCKNKKTTKSKKK